MAVIPAIVAALGLAKSGWDAYQQHKDRNAAREWEGARQNILLDAYNQAQRYDSALGPLRSAGLSAALGFMHGNQRGMFNTPDQPGSLTPPSTPGGPTTVGPSVTTSTFNPHKQALYDALRYMAANQQQGGR